MITERDITLADSRLEKACTKCNCVKPLIEFNKNLKSKDGRKGTCRDCTKASDIQYKYGVDVKSYNKMFSLQEGNCAICGIHQSKLNLPLFVDHCHNSNKVRGLLCNHCNLMLGHAKDNISNLAKGIEYLNKQ